MESNRSPEKGEPTSSGKKGNKKINIYFFLEKERERGGGWCMLSFTVTETKMLKFCPQFSPTISRQVLFCLLSFLFTFLSFLCCSSSLSLFSSLFPMRCPFFFTLYLSLSL
ncbi:hypothetical protein ACJW31_07G033300 [Castanea mollissima]